MEGTFEIHSNSEAISEFKVGYCSVDYVTNTYPIRDTLHRGCLAVLDFERYRDATGIESGARLVHHTKTDYGVARAVPKDFQTSSIVKTPEYIYFADVRKLGRRFYQVVWQYDIKARTRIFITLYEVGGGDIGTQVCMSMISDQKLLFYDPDRYGIKSGVGIDQVWTVDFELGYATISDMCTKKTADGEYIYWRHMYSIATIGQKCFWFGLYDQDNEDQGGPPPQEWRDLQAGIVAHISEDGGDSWTEHIAIGGLFWAWYFPWTHLIVGDQLQILMSVCMFGD